MSGSVLFTDLVGFTEYNGVVGDVAALRVLDQQTSIVSSVISGCDGARIVKELGDGLMVWFATAVDGLGSATQLLAEIDNARSSGTFPLAMRLGMHHGETLARGDDLIGQTVNIAARVCALAGPGELLVSEELVAALGGRSASNGVEPIGPTRVKGIDQPIWLHRIAL